MAARSDAEHHYPDEVERGLRAAGVTPVPGTLLEGNRGMSHDSRHWAEDVRTKWTDWTVRMRVEPPGGAPVDTLFTQKVPPVVGNAIASGSRDFLVLLDPADPSRSRIDCLAFRQRARILNEAGMDPAEQLRVLGELHESGQVTDPEFAAQRALIVGEL